MRKYRPFICFLAALAMPWALAARVRTQKSSQDRNQAQDPDAIVVDPASALADVITAACRGDEAALANSFTFANAAAYRALPPEERKRLLQRFSLLDIAGKPMLSSDQDNHTVIRCETEDGVAEFRFGATRLEDNLAFIPVSVVGGESDDFGLVREAGNWKLLSVGLVLLDIKQLSVQWAASDFEQRENDAAIALQNLSSAIDNYEKTFGKLPDSLAQLGPGPTKQVTPDKAALVSDSLAAGSQGGYRFIYRVVPGVDSSSERYVIEALPEDYGTSGKESFFRDTSGEIHGADNHGASATAADPVWQDQSPQ
jgi:type II secretory pathway pseudopilin PulG